MEYEEEKISVIVPVYNVGDYLKRCLDSIIHNTYGNLEIICVNDGSTDNSKEILEYYSKKDSRIIVINKENGGLSSARNEGLRIATGEYIAFIDSDDWIHEKYFEYLIRGINNVDLVICNYIRISTDDIKIMDHIFKVRPVTHTLAFTNKELKSYVWGKLFRHQLINGIQFDESEKIEDTLFNMEVLLNNKEMKITYVDVQLYYYYIRKGSLVSSIDTYAVLNLAKRFKKYYDKENDIEYKRILAIEIIKRALSARYIFSIVKSKKGVRECNNLMRQCLDFDGNIKYWILYKIPFLYRAFRLLTDPTMLEYEKQLKNI